MRALFRIALAAVKRTVAWVDDLALMMLFV